MRNKALLSGSVRLDAADGEWSRARGLTLRTEESCAHHGRVMKGLTFFLLLPAALKKSKKTVKGSGRAPTCLTAGTASLRKIKPAEEVQEEVTRETGTAALTLTEQQSRNPGEQSNNTALSSAEDTHTHPGHTHTNLRDRNAAMFNNEHMADVHFVVGSPGATQKVPAHKYVLAVGSSVFSAMFYGDLAEGDHEIQIPDVEPAAFLILLKYLYSDEIELEAETVVGTLYAAKKYLVSALVSACVSFLDSRLEASNAFALLSHSRALDESELAQSCWRVIDAQAELALRSEGFLQLDTGTLESVLRRDSLNAKESAVLQAALTWAEAECQRHGMCPTAANKRAVLGEALHLLRLPAMTLAEFANGVAQFDFLTPEETRDIFLWFTAAEKPTLDFPVSPRTGLEPQRCRRFRSSAYRSNQWRYQGRCDSIRFAADRRVFMAGLGLYGSSERESEYDVQIELKRQEEMLAQRLTKFVSDGSSSAFAVFFEQPVQVEPDVFYTVSAVLDGTELSYFGQDGMTEVCCGKVTFQFQSSSDSTNGTGVEAGQIPELVFYT
ncbi:BTB/POZ domain-containing protein 6-A [Tachysurus vachellii]|uniref:BTB/POZ domain-containing protein 6-A n=1 Tax=Tachysurus vachellii TaxID=175792 RepID=UPI00296AA25A|nr:BTB/POZ domain-containing protein 6-A [Tachysurus vachellii]